MSKKAASKVEPLGASKISKISFTAPPLPVTIVKPPKPAVADALSMTIVEGELPKKIAVSVNLVPAKPSVGKIPATNAKSLPVKPSAIKVTTINVKPPTTLTSKKPILKPAGGAKSAKATCVNIANTPIGTSVGTKVELITLPDVVGQVTLKYEMYTESFTITNGCLKCDEVDDILCLSFVMPKCIISLSKLSPAELKASNDLSAMIKIHVSMPSNIFEGLEVNQIYFVYVTEDETERLKQAEERKLTRVDMAAVGNLPRYQLTEPPKKNVEGCTCLFGVEKGTCAYCQAYRKHHHGV